MAPFIFIRENDYVGLAILVVALEEAGFNVAKYSNVQLSEMLKPCADWEGQIDHLKLLQARNRLQRKLWQPEKYKKLVRDVARIAKYLEKYNSNELFLMKS